MLSAGGLPQTPLGSAAGGAYSAPQTPLEGKGEEGRGGEGNVKKLSLWPRCPPKLHNWLLNKKGWEPMP